MIHLEIMNQDLKSQRVKIFTPRGGMVATRAQVHVESGK